MPPSFLAKICGMATRLKEKLRPTTIPPKGPKDTKREYPFLENIQINLIFFRCAQCISRHPPFQISVPNNNPLIFLIARMTSYRYCYFRQHAFLKTAPCQFSLYSSNKIVTIRKKLTGRVILILTMFKINT